MEDPFFLAFKACTKVDSRDASPAGFDGTQVALSIFRGEKSMECKRRDFQKNYDDSDHHRTRKAVSFNHRRTMRETSFDGEGNGRGKLIATSTHGTLHQLLSSIEERASRVETRRPNSHTLMLEKDEERTISITKGAHHHMSAAGKASSNGFLIHVGVANNAKKDDPIHSKPSRREEHLIGAEVGGHSKPRKSGHRKPRESGHFDIYHKPREPKHANNVKAYNGREINDAVDRIDQGHSKAKHSAKVVEFNYCRGGYLKNSDNDVKKHQCASKPNMSTDILGCNGLNEAAIHPSLHFQLKLFSAHHS